MGTKLPAEQLALYKDIDEILFYKWDPIGISDSDWSRDEYQSYLPKVFQLALDNSDPSLIAKYLTWVATERMGLNEASNHDMKIAELVLVAKEKHLK